MSSTFAYSLFESDGGAVMACDAFAGYLFTEKRKLALALRAEGAPDPGVVNAYALG